MKSFVRVPLLLLSLIVLASTAAEAHAQWGGYLGGGFVGARGLYGSRLYGDYEKQPYFALHPPVYYSSEIVRRPYGFSPFALPPGILPAELRAISGRQAVAPVAAPAPTPEMIENPFYRAGRPAEAAAGTPSPAAITAGGDAQMIQNPFYQPAVRRHDNAAFTARR
ncbi:hypothetical protein [Lignipirellula cremea]|uniref:Uncharacterized protein n=1 Tax=Lignipirellula cremea TaxID=2528010 RepID=A0A518DM10_9BACT|nr:hypothetical protein [Lignipirellula cremea]QDU92879.1 hypothetical protein Pla8534_06520 [Lignipirellula cremea]